MKKSASKQPFLATEKLCPPSACTSRFRTFISSSQHFPRKRLQRLLSTANLSASTDPSQPRAFTVFTREASTQLLAFTIFTPKNFPPPYSTDLTQHLRRKSTDACDHPFIRRIVLPS